jgi:alginate O-acetyltransferase complex protein AlgI
LLFTEPTFLFLFLPLLLALYFASRAAGARAHGGYANWLLLIASIIFYAKGGGLFTWLMLALIAFNYWMAIAVDRGRETGSARRWLTGAVTVDLIVLGIFKYANFFADNVNALLSALDRQPIGVPRCCCRSASRFFTFHAISYVVDVYRRDAVAQKSPVHAALYMLLFPQLIAGPIIRYRDIADQLARANGHARRFRIRCSTVRDRPGQKGVDRQRRRRTCGSDFRACRSRSCRWHMRGSGSSVTRCRSISISLVTPTWRSASAGCSASDFRRTFAGRT